MMLKNVLGLRGEVHRLRAGQKLLCPACGQEKRFPLFRNATAFSVLNISIVDLKIGYFSVCPGCGAVFTVKQSAGRIAESEPGFKLKPDYLVQIRPAVTFKK